MNLSIVSPRVVGAGKFIVWADHHFVAVSVSRGQYEVFDNGRSMILMSRAELEQGRRCIWFKLARRPDSVGSVRSSVSLTEALARRTVLLARHSIVRQPAYPATWTDEMVERVELNRQAALTIRASQLIRPSPPPAWIHPMMPSAPVCFRHMELDLPAPTWLSQLPLLLAWV